MENRPLFRRLQLWQENRRYRPPRPSHRQPEESALPPRPQKWKDLPANIPAAHRRFVLALRRMRELSHRTQQQIADDAFLAATSLSNHLNGGRVPEADHLAAVYKVLDGDALAGQKAVPYSLDFLLELRAQALVRHCRCCSVGYPAEPIAIPAEATHASPASRTVRRRARGARLHRYRRYRASHALPEQAEVPVPLREGDRHLSAHISEAWPEVADLAERLASGMVRDAEIMLWSAATTLSADGIQLFVAGCRSAGLDEAADQVITNASRRDAQAVLNIAAAFYHEKQHEDVGRLLTAATRPE